MMKVTIHNIGEEDITVADDAYEVQIEVPGTECKYKIRAHRDGRLIVLFPEDEYKGIVRRMFIEPIGATSILVNQHILKWR